MAKTGKRLTKAYEGIDPEAPPLAVDDAVKEIKKRASAKFDETVEIAMNLNLDPRKPDRLHTCTSRLSLSARVTTSRSSTATTNGPSSGTRKSSSTLSQVIWLARSATRGCPPRRRTDR